MANSLVSIISQIFGTQMIARVATSLGISPALAQTLANAAVPTVLAALGSLAATPAGAQKIAEQVQSQDSNILGSLVNSLGTPDQSSFLNSGSGMLSSLLGGGATGALAGALAKHTGADATQAQSMLGVVAPATFGALGQQDPAIWSTSDGISSLFRREQSAITSAIPAGLAGALGATGLLNNLPGFNSSASAASDAAHAVRDRAAATLDNVRHTATQAQDRAVGAGSHAREAAAAAGMPGWLKIVLPVALIAALAWFFIPSPTPAPKPAPAPAPAPTSTAPAAPPATPNTAQRAAAELAEFAQKANATVAGLSTSLGGITNAEQARAAQPQLDQAATELNALAGNFAKLPAEARSALAGPMQGAIGTLNAQISRVTALPGVGEVLKPITDRISAAASSFKA